MRNSRNNILQQKQGVALMTVVLFFMVMVIMLGGLSILTHGNFRNSSMPTDSTAAYYAAESGINTVLNDLDKALDFDDLTSVSIVDFNNKIAAFETSNSSVVIDLSDNRNKGVYAEVTFNRLDTSNLTGSVSFRVLSKGYVGGTTRTLATEISVDYVSGSGTRDGFAVKHAILTQQSLTLGNNINISLSEAEIAKLISQGKDPVTWVASMSTQPSDGTVYVNTSFSGNIELYAAAKDKGVVTQLGSGKIEYTLSSETMPRLDFDPVRIIAKEAFNNNTRIPSTSQNLINLFAGNTNTSPTSDGVYVLPESATGTYYIPEMIFNQANITIKSDHNVFILTDRLNFNQPVKFTGIGEVTIYVSRKVASGQDKFAFDNTNGTPGVAVVESNPIQFTLPSTQNLGETNFLGRRDKPYLFIVYIDEIKTRSGGSLINVSYTTPNGFHMGGSFMFHNASVTFGNSNSVAGYFMTGGNNLTISNNGDVFTTLYYAPNAHVELANNGSMRGAVISKSFSSGQSSNTKIVYDTTFTEHFPFNVTSPIVGDSYFDGIPSLVLRINETIEQ